jgi:hypothetical protein
VDTHDSRAFVVAAIVGALLLVVSFLPTIIQKMRKR